MNFGPFRFKTHIPFLFCLLPKPHYKISINRQFNRTIYTHDIISIPLSPSQASIFNGFASYPTRIVRNCFHIAHTPHFSMNISDSSIHPVYRIDFYTIQFQHLNFNTIWQTIFSWYGTTTHKHSAVSTRFHMHPFYSQDIIFELSATSYYPDGQTFTDEDAIPEFPSIFFSIHLMPFYFFHLYVFSISETLFKRNNRTKFK